MAHKSSGALPAGQVPRLRLSDSAVTETQLAGLSATFAVLVAVSAGSMIDE